MTAWKLTLKLKDLFHDESRTFEERRDGIVGRIKKAPFYDADDFDLEDLVDQLEHAETIEAFDDYWAEFYNYCDDNRIWVETV